MYCARHRSAQDHVRGLGARLRELLHGIFRLPLGVGELLAVSARKVYRYQNSSPNQKKGQHRWPVAFSNEKIIVESGRSQPNLLRPHRAMAASDPASILPALALPNIVSASQPVRTDKGRTRSPDSVPAEMPVRPYRQPVVVCRGVKTIPQSHSDPVPESEEVSCR